jgi:hypothetical protein
LSFSRIDAASNADFDSRTNRTLADEGSAGGGKPHPIVIELGKKTKAGPLMDTDNR